MPRLAFSFTATFVCLALCGCIGSDGPVGPLQAGLEAVATHRAVLVGESDADFPLGLPRHAVVDKAGRTHVSDYLSATVAVLDAGGEVVSTWGVRGDGPGEFREITSMSAGPAGSIVVYDRGLSRISWVDPRTGEVVDALRVPQVELAIELRPTSMGRWVAWHRSPVWAEVVDTAPMDHLRLLDGTGEVLVGQLLEFPSSVVHVIRDAGGMLAVADPFGAEPLVAVTPSGDILLARSDSVGFTRYAVRSTDVEVQARVWAAVEPEAATSAEIEEAFMGEPGGGLSAFPAALQRRIRESAASVPPLTGLNVGGDGNIWIGVRARGIPSGRWLKVSAEGDFLLSVDVGSGERVVAEVAGLLVTLPIPSPDAWPVVRFYRVEDRNQ